MDALRPSFDDLRQLLDGADSVVISGHEKADGDAVGAVASLRRHLELEGKNVTALLSEPLNRRYGFMEFGRNVEVYEPELHDDLVREADVLIMCDLSTMSRLGPLRAAFESSKATIVCFDHHPCDNGGPADIFIHDHTATATGCLTYDYIKHVGGEIDREIAESVFVSISTDTGWFRYPNTSARVMDLVAELASFRLDLPGMFRAIYQSYPTSMVRLLGHVARTMNEECDGELIWAVVRKEIMEDLGVERYEVDPILDVLRSSDDVRIVALFTERDDGSMAVSLRSRGDLNMNIVASLFGGGGHVYAAGTILPAEAAESNRKSLLAHLRRLVGTNAP
jgi:phosphoesterase RecJ-like protein